MQNEEYEMEEELEEQEPESKEEKIEIDFNIDPVERIEIEINASQSQNSKCIGEYLKNEFKTNDPLKNAYKDRKITLEAVEKYVMECAKKHLNSKNGMIEDKIVFGWVIHYIQDEEVKVPEKETYSVTLTKSEEEKIKEKVVAEFEAKEREKLEKEKAKKEAKIQKSVEREKKRNEEIGQMSLFEM